MGTLRQLQVPPSIKTAFPKPNDCYTCTALPPPFPSHSQRVADDILPPSGSLDYLLPSPKCHPASPSPMRLFPELPAFGVANPFWLIRTHPGFTNILPNPSFPFSLLPSQPLIPLVRTLTFLVLPAPPPSISICRRHYSKNGLLPVCFPLDTYSFFFFTLLSPHH